MSIWDTKSRGLWSGLTQPNIHYVRKEDAVDPDRLARAITLHETGARDIAGGSGERGLFQFKPETWERVSKEILGKVVPQTMETEWNVARQKISKLLQKYGNVKDVAKVWNTSLGGAEKPLSVKGVNKFGVKYDSDSYAEKVAALYASDATSSPIKSLEIQKQPFSNGAPQPRLPLTPPSTKPVFQFNKQLDDTKQSRELVGLAFPAVKANSFEEYKQMTRERNKNIASKEGILNLLPGGEAGGAGFVGAVKKVAGKIPQGLEALAAEASKELPPSSPSSIGQTFRNLKTNILEYVQNTDERIRQLQLNPKLKITDESNIYQKLTLLPGKTAAKVESGYDKATDIADDIVAFSGKSKAGVESARKEVNEYLQALHAPERNAAIGEGAAGMKTEDALNLTAAAKKEVKEIADKALALNKETLTILREGGVITDDLFKTLTEKYKNHVPLQRVMDEADDIGSAMGRSLDVKSTGIKKAKGSDREVADILTNIVTNHEQAIIRAEKNIADNATLKFVRDNEKELGDLFEIRLPRFIGKTEDGLPILQKDTDPRVLHLFEDGKAKEIFIKDPNLAIALRGVGREKLGATMNAIGSITRFYSGLATRFNPEFAIPNKIRDLQETITFLASQGDVSFKGAASTLGKDPASIKAVTDWLRGTDSAGAKLYQEMIEAGGTTGGMGLSTRNQVQINIDKIFDTARSNPRKATKNLIQYVDNFNRVFEDSTRLSVYKAALERGLSKDRAAFLAKEASINFNRMGKGGPIINALYMFSNASIQGSTKMIRAMANPKVAATVVTTVGASVAAVNEWNDLIDPDWRNKVTKWDRMNGLTVMLPSEEGSRYFTIPVGWGIKPILVMANGVGDSYHDQEFDPKTLSYDVLNSVLNAYNPVGGTTVASAVTPTAADMFNDVRANVSWSGAKIRPDWDQNAPKDIQYFDSLTETLQGRIAIAGTKKLNEATGIAISPADVNYVTDQLVGGAGRTIRKTINTITGFFTDPVPLDEYPFVSRFYRERTDEETGQGTMGEAEELKALKTQQSRDNFYRRQAAERTHEELKKLSPEEAAARFEMIKETNPLLATKLRQIAKDEAKGLTYIERSIQDLGVENGERARYIYQKLEALESQEAKAAKFMEWKKKGLISRDVAKQIGLLVQNPPKENRL